VELADALGNLVRCRLMLLHHGETTGLADLLEGHNSSALPGDETFDAD
jgi:hypothetical protein